MSKYAVLLLVIVEARSKRAAVTSVAKGIAREQRPDGALRDFLLVRFPLPTHVRQVREEDAEL